MLLLWFPLSLSANIIHVSQGSSIQAAILQAVKCDTVVVDTGTYYENLVFPDKSIVVGSKFLLSGDSSHISQTTIIGSSSATISFTDLIHPSELVGFTLTTQGNGGPGTRRIIYCSNSSPIIRDNLIFGGYARNNFSGFDSTMYGGGMMIVNNSKTSYIPKYH